MLRAKSEERLREARDLLREAAEDVRGQRRVGYLTFPDRSAFGRIIGYKGETCKRIQAETHTTIRVPNIDGSPDETTVVILGTGHVFMLDAQLIRDRHKPFRFRAKCREG
jgi:hypothetical protein